MRFYLALILSILLMSLLVACTAPPPTEQQLEAYNRLAQLRSTEAAAAELIAAAAATEAAAAQQIAQLTAEAALPSETIAVTATPSLTQLITVTMPLTGEVAAETIASPLTMTVGITVTATPTVVMTATATPEATPAPAAASVTTPTAIAATTATPAPAAPLILTWSWPWAGSAGGVLPGPAITATPVAPSPTPTPVGQVAVTSQQANLRSGPGTNFDVLATARSGDRFDVYGSDAAQNWWRVCCVEGNPAWISRTVARFEGDAQAAPVVGTLLPDDLQASWAMRWECRGRGCNQEMCTGQSQAAALRVLDDRWLEVKREAQWDDGCSEPEDWLTQVDRYTGRERESAGVAPLFNIWEGANPGPANRNAELAGLQLALWCTETRTQEVEQTGGWTAAFEGQACYDVESGILALMQYAKRWLFTGTVNNQSFDRQYFGDYELIQQVLLDTNAPLSGK